MKTAHIAISAVLAATTLFSAADTAGEAAARSAAATWANAAQAGDVAAIWNALPESWRSSTVAAAKALGAQAKANPAVWSAARDCLSEVAGAVAKKSGFAADLVSRTGLPAAKASIAGDGTSPALVRTAAKLGAIARAASPEALAGGDVAKILSAQPLSMPGVTDSLPAAAAALAASSFASRANADGSVTVGIPGGSSSKTVKMVQKDGKWVPAKLAELFSGSASWKDAISGASLDANGASAMVSALGLIRKTAAGAAQATTQEQFDQSATAASFPLLMLGSAFSSGSGAQGTAGAAQSLLRGLLGK